MFETALSTPVGSKFQYCDWGTCAVRGCAPLPMKTSGSPSRSSTASWLPVVAPEGAEARNRPVDPLTSNSCFQNVSLRTVLGVQVDFHGRIPAGVVYLGIDNVTRCLKQQIKMVYLSSVKARNIHRWWRRRKVAFRASLDQ